MSLLPGQILPYTEPIGTVNADGSVTIDKNWWLLIYNICQQVLSNGSGIPSNALIAAESTDTDAVDADAIALRVPLSAATLLATDDRPQDLTIDSARVLLALAADPIPLTSADIPGGFGGFANPTAKVGLTAVNGSATTATRSDGAPALDQSIAPIWTGDHTFTPGAGIAITINGSPVFVNNNAKPCFALNSAGSNYGLIQNDSSNNWSLATGTSNTILGTSVIKWNATGNVSIPAPTSGDALTLANVSGSNALTVTGNSAGTAVIRANTQASTGAQTASFSATNKPGAANGSPQKWLPINADGTTYYVPLFS